MSRNFIPTVYAARDPVDERRVYLGAEGWVSELARAEVAMDADEDVILAALCRAGERAGHVRDVRPIPVRVVDGRPCPLSLELAEAGEERRPRPEAEARDFGAATPRVEAERAA